MLGFSPTASAPTATLSSAGAVMIEGVLDGVTGTIVAQAIVKATITSTLDGVTGTIVTRAPARATFPPATLQGVSGVLTAVVSAAVAAPTSSLSRVVVVDRCGGGFDLKRNDRSPDYVVVLESPPGTPVNLSGCGVRFFMTRRGDTTPKVNAWATVVGAGEGRVKYSWGPTDTDREGGYRAEFEVSFANGVKRTFPNDDYLHIQILEDLG